MADLTLKQRVKYAIFGSIARLVLFFVWRTCRVVQIIGTEHSERFLKQGNPVIPCFWHQHHVFCTWYMTRLIKQGAKIGFLISPSRDGEIPAKLARAWGGVVVRGSTTRSGAAAMRDMYTLVVKQGISLISTSDGPQGPQHTFKIGDVLLSQFTQAPLLPLAYAAEKCWMLNSWDRFMIPKPFSRVVIAIGEPVQVAKGIIAEDLEPVRLQMENTLKALTQQAQDALK